MKMLLGIVLGLFLAGQYAMADGSAKSDEVEDMTDQQGAVEQFEQTLEEAPTAAGMPDQESGEVTDQAQEPIETGEESDMYQEEADTEEPQP
ncbi:hypothetical protein [Alkalimarinus coralli]|uniref:hypothetical protein n=1 Tax=Alkalimarinus coralli TaxID=2935863 RepID=UPI00202B1A6B|nr:hypothetical protein [Alkalimarinus coralli]